MKKIYLLLMLICLFFVIAGCGDDIGDRTEITFWHMSPVGSESYAATKQIIQRFNDSQDKFYVKGTGFSFWDYWDKLDVAISSRTAPDVGLSTLDDVISRASAGVLYNISDLMADDEESFDLEDFYENQLEFAAYENDLYALPFTSTTRVLFYNLDLFAAAGLSEEDVPTTWSELHAVSKQLDIVDSKGNIQQLGFDPTYGEGTYHGFLWQKGLDFFDEDLNPTLNTQGHYEVLQWMVDFNTEYTRNQLDVFGDANEMLGINPFAAERVAMIIQNDGLYQIIKNAGATFNYGVTYIPVPDEDGIRVNWGSGFSIELYDNGKGNVVKKEGAYEFLKYLMSYETQIDLAIANGWIMASKSAMATVSADNAILARLIEEVAYAKDKIYIPYAPSWHGNDWQPYYTAAINREKTVQKALSEARAHYLQKRDNWQATR